MQAVFRDDDLMAFGEEICTKRLARLKPEEVWKNDIFSESPGLFADIVFFPCICSWIAIHHFARFEIFTLPSPPVARPIRHYNTE
jgi:hypothetical protein